MRLVSIFAAAIALAGCGGGSVSISPVEAAWTIQLPVNAKKKRSGRMATTSPAKAVRPYYFKSGSKQTMFSPGLPCAKSPNSEGCRTEASQSGGWSSSTLSGTVTVSNIPSGKSASIIQACGKRCPSLMVRYEAEGRVSWYTGDKYDAGTFPGTYPQGKSIKFKVEIGSSSGKITLGGQTMPFKMDPKTKPWHWKYGCYSKTRCKSVWSSVKAN